MSKPAKQSTDFEQLPDPGEMVLMDKFKFMMKILSGLWTVCLILIIIVPLFDFPGNQLITTFAYLYVFGGLIALFLYEYFQKKLYQLFVKIWSLFHKKDFA